MAAATSEADVELALTLLLETGALPTDLSRMRVRMGVPTGVGAAGPCSGARRELLRRAPAVAAPSRSSLLGNSV